MDYFSQIFGSSPVKPLQRHMAKVNACVKELIPFFNAVIQNHWDEATASQQRIKALEHEADALKKELRIHLPKGLFMPMSRRDLLEVLTMQDRIANKTKDIAGLMVGRKMTFPDDLGPRFLEFINRSIDAADQAQQAINELDELVETGFRGNEVQIVEDMIKKLDVIEADTDRIQVEIRTALIKMENNLPPIDVMFTYQVIDWIGDLGDLSQRVGSRLQLILAR